MIFPRLFVLNRKFIFEITIIKKYNDDEELVQNIKDVIKRSEKALLF